MPCLDGREDEDREDQQHMMEGGELLCGMLRRAEAAGSVNTTFPRSVREWWKRHKERDAKRESDH